MENTPNYDTEEVTTSPELGLKVILLRRRDEYIDVFRAEQELSFQGAAVPYFKSRSYLMALYTSIRVLYEKTRNKDLMPEILRARTAEDFQAAFYDLDLFLYEKGFTRPKMFTDLRSKERIR